MSINWKRYTLGALMLAAFALLLFGCGGGGGASTSGATKSISGIVSDPQTGLPVANARVAAYGIDANGAQSTAALGNPATTDANGGYTLQIPASYAGSAMVEASVPASNVLRQLRQLASGSGPVKVRAAVPQTDVAQATVPPVMLNLATDAAVEFVRQNCASSFSPGNIRKANAALETIFGANFAQIPPPASATDLNTSKAQQDLMVSVKALNLVLANDSSLTVATIVASMVNNAGMVSVSDAGSVNISDAIKSGIAQAVLALSAAGSLPPEYQPSAAINTALSNAQSASVLIPDLSDAVAPSAPQNLTAVAPMAKKVVLTWSASTDDVGVAGYAICRAGASGVYTVIDTVNATGSAAASFSYTDLSAAPKSAYNYRVLAFDKARNHSAQSAAVAVTTPAAADVTAPAKPAGLVAIGYNSTQVNLKWPLSLKTNADGTTTPAAVYNVYRDYQLIATVTENIFVDKAVAPGTCYTYFVKASDADGNLSAATQLLTLRTAADPTATAPAAASALVLGSAATAAKVPLAWTASTSEGVTYNVYRDSQLIASGITAAAYNDCAVIPNTSYIYTVTAVSGSAESAASNPLSVATPADPKATDADAPTAPTNLIALSATGKSVSLSWGPSFKVTGDRIVAGYAIFRGDANAKNFVKISTVRTPGFTDTTVSPSSTYSYQVKAFSTAGVLSSASATWIVITPVAADLNDITAPTAPTDLALASDPTSGSVALKWSASTDDGGVAGYLVYRNGALIAEVKGTSCTDNSVAGGKNYVYTVKAFDNPGNVSAASSELPVTTPAAIPGTYNVSGSVLINGTTTGLPGINVTLTSAAGATSTVTDANGNFSFTGVANNTGYTLTAAATGFYSLTPESRSFRISGASVAGQNFNATLSGAVTGGTGYPDGIIIGGITYPGGTVIGGVQYPDGSIVGGIAFANGGVSGTPVFPTGSISGSLSW